MEMGCVEFPSCRAALALQLCISGCHSSSLIDPRILNVIDAWTLLAENARGAIEALCQTLSQACRP